MSSRYDTFSDLARYYDGIMDEINYDRWVAVTSWLAELLKCRDFLHLDVACGTGSLIKRLVRYQWRCIGIDLSWSMLRASVRSGARVPLAQADMSELPMRSESVSLVTCLFDSLNFVLTAERAERSVQEFARVAKPNSLIYFDLVTERMVTEHFAGQKWTEDNGRFSTTWEGSFDAAARLARTFVQVNSGSRVPILERIYTLEEVERWCAAAGLTLLGVFDGETWDPAGPATIRVDVVAWKGPARPGRRAWKQAVTGVRQSLGQITG